MLRIAALNDTASSEDTTRKIQLTKTKEAKEAEAFSAYNKALTYQQKGHLEHAEKLLRNLLDDPFLQEASDLVEDEEINFSSHQGLQLLYSIHKNLASIMLERNELREAMKYYIEAVRIDPSEVTVWFRMGQTACKLDKFHLAKQCFQQALQCNASHWPSLDKAITVTFSLGDYLMCLEHISTALEKDCCYPKGLALRKQILKEQPSLENLTKELFEYCDPSIFTASIEEEEKKKFLDESLKIRSKCHQQVNDYKDERSKPMAFLEPLIPFTWKNFGQQLIKLYDHATTSDPPKSLCLEMDLRDYYFLDPSVFLGQSSNDAPQKEKQQEDTSAREKRKNSKEKIMTLLQKPADTSETNEMNAFQIASEKNNLSRAVPETLSVGDEAKENALMKRLFGETVSSSRANSPFGQRGTVVDNGDVPESKRPKLITLQDSENSALDDMAGGNDIDLPLLADVDMDLDINLSDLRRMDLKPELLLKAGEEELALSDAKSLENVLSSVIDMEIERKETLDKNLESETKDRELAESESERKPDEKEKGDTKLISITGGKTSPTYQREQGIRDVIATASASPPGPTPKKSVESEIKVIDGSGTLSFYGKEFSSQTSDGKSEENLKTGQQINQESSQGQVQCPKENINSEKSKSPITTSLQDLTKSSTVSSKPDIFSVERLISTSAVNLQTKTSPPDLGSSSPITSSLLLSSTGECPSSATFYHKMLHESVKKNQPGVTSPSLKCDNVMQSELKPSKLPVSEPRYQRSISDPLRMTPLEEGEIPVPRRVLPMSVNISNPTTASQANYGPVSISLLSPPPHLSPRKSTGEFIEEVVKSHLGLSSPTKSGTQADVSSPVSVQRLATSSSDSFSSTQKKQPTAMSPPVSSFVSKKSPTKLPVSSEFLPSSLSSSNRLALLNIPERYLNSLSVMEATSVSAKDSERILPDLSSHRQPFNLSFLSSRSRHPDPGRFPGRLHSPVHPLISPPAIHGLGGNPFFPTDRPSHLVSSLLSPPPKGPSAAPVLPPYPLLSHQQDYSFAPLSASMMASLYPPLSPASKYPLIPSTSPSYLQSRLLGHSLDSTMYLPGSSLAMPHFLPSATSPTVPMTSPLSRKQGSPFASQPFQTELQQSSSKTEQRSTHPTSFQARLNSLVETQLASSNIATTVKTSPKKSSPIKDSSSTHTPSCSTRTPGVSKRGPKRKILDLDENDWADSYKRRSTRNRTGRGAKKEKPTVNYRILVKKHFPPSLIKTPEPESQSIFFSNSHDNKDSESKVDKWNPDIDMSNVRSLAGSEESDVKSLIKECFKHHGLIDMMYKFLLRLAEKVHDLWMDDLADIFIQVYSRLRNHLTIPSIFEGLDDLDSDVLSRHSKIILAHCELVVDKARSDKMARTLCSTPSKSNNDDEERSEISALLGEHYDRDMEFLYLVSRCGKENDSITLKMTYRFYWLKAKQHQMVGETMDAIDCFQIILEITKESKGDEESLISIFLPNMSEDKVISAESAAHELDSLHRFERLENTRKLYDQGNYVQVVDNLLTVFRKPPKTQSASQKERPSQLLLLLDSLIKSNSKEECMKWAEFAIDDCLTHFRRVTNINMKQAWCASLISSFDTIERLLLEKPEIISWLDQRCVLRLSHNLVAVIEMNLEASTPTDMPVDSLLPWKILYRILKFEEEKAGDRLVEAHQKEKDDDDEDEFTNKPSLQMLLDAHEYLGRHGWCTKGDGDLLLFLMSQLQTRMDELDEDDREELVTPYEQCVLCLYNHPVKKGKSKHLCDHNAKKMNLTWERSGPLFAYFTYNTMPEFDSKKMSSISSDVEHLLRRIYNLVPEDVNPGLHLERVNAFIDGSLTVNPASQLKSFQADPHKIQALLYYLLADFYFKNNEFKKAAKFYMLDLVINANRMDSWAGLALAKMSQITHELNAIDIKMDSPAPKKWSASLRCFQRAVDLESKNHKLWMEYGFLSYQQHSHASRQIKLFRTLSISDDVYKTAQVRHESLLLSAGHSFDQAEKCEGDGSGDDWLVYYMLGKIAEKQKKKPSIFLEHYIKAAKCLHEERAVYPKKIVFTTTPPHLALESLEVFYRIHASVIKLLQSGSLAVEDLPMVDGYLTQALKGKFARCEGKPKEQIEEERDDIFSSQTMKSPHVKPPVQPPKAKTKPVYHRNPMDHEYSYFKSTSDSQSSDNPDAESVQWPGKGQQQQQQQQEQHLQQQQQQQKQHEDQIPMEVDRPRPDIMQKDESHVEEKMEFEEDSGKANRMEEVTPEAESVSGEKSNQDIYMLSTSSSEMKEVHAEKSDVAKDPLTSAADENAQTQSRPEFPAEPFNLEEKKSPSLTDDADKRFSDFSVEKSTAGISQSESAASVTEIKKIRGDADSVAEAKTDPAAMEVDDDDKASESTYTGVNSSQDNTLKSQSQQSSSNLYSCSGDDVFESQTSDDPISNNSQSSLSQEIHEEKPEERKLLQSHESEAVEERQDKGHGHSQATPPGPAQVSSESETTSSATKILKKQASEGFIPSRHLSLVEMDDEDMEENVTRDSKEIDTKESVDRGDESVIESMPPTSLSSDKDNAKMSSEEEHNETSQQVKKDKIQMSETSDKTEGTKLSQKYAVEKEKWEDEDQEKKSLENSVNIDSTEQGLNNQQTSQPPRNLPQANEQQKHDSNIDGNDISKHVEDKRNDKADNLKDLETVFISSSKISDKGNEIASVSENETSTGQTMDTEVCEKNRKKEESRDSRRKSIDDEKVSLTKDTGSDVDSKVGSNETTQDPVALKAEITRKCIAGLQLCASRFSSHYRSIHRLARFYHHSKDHKNLILAHDLLLGRSDWQQQAHMPAPGLFYDRKLNNFFQGLWKIPNDDIDRAGSFASHLFQSVSLLLEVLCELGELEMMKFIRDQLKRNPDSTKKYLRDAERQALVEEAFKKMLELMQKKMVNSDSWPEEYRESHLASMYRLWIHGKGSKHSSDANPLLLKAFRIMMKGRTDVTRLTVDQAIMYCKQNVSKTLSQTPASNQTGKERSKAGQSSTVDRPKTNATDSTTSSQKVTEQGADVMEVHKEKDNGQTHQTKDSGSSQKATTSKSSSELSGSHSGSNQTAPHASDSLQMSPSSYKSSLIPANPNPSSSVQIDQRTNNSTQAPPATSGSSSVSKSKSTMGSSSVVQLASVNSNAQQKPAQSSAVNLVNQRTNNSSQAPPATSGSSSMSKSKSTMGSSSVVQLASANSNAQQKPAQSSAVNLVNQRTNTNNSTQAPPATSGSSSVSKSKGTMGSSSVVQLASANSNAQQKPAQSSAVNLVNQRTNTNNSTQAPPTTSGSSSVSKSKSTMGSSSVVQLTSANSNAQKPLPSSAVNLVNQRTNNSSQAPPTTSGSSSVSKSKSTMGSSSVVQLTSANSNVQKPVPSSAVNLVNQRTINSTQAPPATSGSSSVSKSKSTMGSSSVVQLTSPNSNAQQKPAPLSTVNLADNTEDDDCIIIVSDGE